MKVDIGVESFLVKKLAARGIEVVPTADARLYQGPIIGISLGGYQTLYLEPHTAEKLREALSTAVWKARELAKHMRGYHRWTFDRRGDEVWARHAERERRLETTKLRKPKECRVCARGIPMGTSGCIRSHEPAPCAFCHRMPATEADMSFAEHVAQRLPLGQRSSCERVVIADGRTVEVMVSMVAREGAKEKSR